MARLFLSVFRFIRAIRTAILQDVVLCACSSWEFARKMAVGHRWTPYPFLSFASTSLRLTPEGSGSSILFLFLVLRPSSCPQQKSVKSAIVAPRKSNRKFSISFTILTFLLQFAFCPCFMHIFYWYASTPNSIGGLPASCAPISGAAPL